MNSLIENKGFNWKGYEIPAFTLNSGEMIRFWIQIIPATSNFGGYELAKELQAILIKKRTISGLKINTFVSFADDIYENRFKSLVSPLKVEEFLKKKRKLSTEVSESIMQMLHLSGKERIQEIGYTKRRQLSITSLYELETCVAFDYYGLDPTGEEKITELIRNKIEKGNSAIGFDNLYYMTETEPYDFIKRVIVKRNE